MFGCDAIRSGGESWDNAVAESVIGLFKTEFPVTGAPMGTSGVDGACYHRAIGHDGPVHRKRSPGKPGRFTIEYHGEKGETRPMGRKRILEDGCPSPSGITMY